MKGWLAAAVLFALGAGAALTWMSPPDGSDQVSESERQSRQAAFTQMEGIRVSAVSDDEIDAALDYMQLPPAERSSLRERLEIDAGNQPSSAAAVPASKRLQLARITLWDTHAQDGDVVAVASAGYHREVLITHAPQRIMIPVDGSTTLQIIGVRDGGGGITLGAEGADSTVMMPIMSVGQTITVPLTY